MEDSRVANRLDVYSSDSLIGDYLKETKPAYMVS